MKGEYEIPEGRAQYLRRKRSQTIWVRGQKTISSERSLPGTATGEERVKKRRIQRWIKKKRGKQLGDSRVTERNTIRL